MGILPNKININNIAEEVETEISLEDKPLGLAIKFDFDKNKFVFVDGKPVYFLESEKKEQILQWAKLNILTVYNKYEIYKGTDFGFEDYYNFIGFALTDFIRSELRREITEKMLTNRIVNSVTNISINQEEEKLYTKFTLILKDGTSVVGEV